MTEQWNLQESAARVEAAQKRAQHTDGLDALVKYADVIDTQSEFIATLLKVHDINVQREGQYNQRIDAQLAEIDRVERERDELYAKLYSPSATKLAGVLLSGAFDAMTPDEIAALPGQVKALKAALEIIAANNTEDYRQTAYDALHSMDTPNHREP